MITVESACILSAETIGILFYNYSILLSIPVAMLAGALTIAPLKSIKIKVKSQSCDSYDCNDI